MRVVSKSESMYAGPTAFEDVKKLVFADFDADLLWKKKMTAFIKPDIFAKAPKKTDKMMGVAFSSISRIPKAKLYKSKGPNVNNCAKE